MRTSLALERREQRLPLAPVGVARPLDVLLVVPRYDRRALHELLRRGADRRPVLLQRGDHVGAGGDEARAVAQSSTSAC